MTPRPSTFIRNPTIALFLLSALLLLPSCSPRDFLTRRLAADLIAASDTFAALQPFQLRTGIISNQDHLSSHYIVLQHHGWIAASTAPCPPTLTPPPCWDVTLTPAGVDTFQNLMPPGDAGKPTFTIFAARRELVAITGIAKQSNTADVDFSWKWIPLNEVGAALYPSGLRYYSTASFRSYDDGWRLADRAPHSPESLDDELRNAQPAH